MADFRAVWTYGKSGGIWQGGGSKLFRPGRVWVKTGGAWIPVLVMGAGRQHDYGTPLVPDIQMDWYQFFRDIQPTGIPGSLVIGSDDTALTESPGDPGKTAVVGWSNGGGYDPSYDQMYVEWYRNGFLDHSTLHNPAATQGHSLPVYHHAANDLSYPADTLYAVLRYYNQDASPINQYGPTSTTSTISY